MRAVGSLVADSLAILLFVAIGLMQHGSALTTSSVGLVGWPFAIGMLLGHLAIRSWRSPFALWPHGVLIWAITIVAAMAIRTLLRAGTETSFVIVTAIVLAVFMLGWRAIASFATRHERREVVADARHGGTSEADPGESDDAVEPEGTSTSAGSHSA